MLSVVRHNVDERRRYLDEMSFMHAMQGPQAESTREREHDNHVTPGRSTLVEQSYGKATHTVAGVEATGAATHVAATGESSADGWQMGPSVKQMDAPAERETDITTKAMMPSREGTPGRRTVAVGERVTLSSPSAGTWTASAVGKGGQLKAQGGTYHWVAPERADRVTIEAAPAKQGGKPQTVELEVIEPQDIEFEYVRDTAPAEHKYKQYGSGMITKVNFLPYTVSWAATEWLEIGGGPSNKQGAFAQFDDGELMHKPTPKAIPEPRAEDKATFSMSQISRDADGNGIGGSFQWGIPNHFQVKGGASKEFVTTVQTMKVEGSPLDGFIQVSKKGKGTAAISSTMRGPGGKELPKRVERATDKEGTAVEGSARAVADRAGIEAGIDGAGIERTGIAAVGEGQKAAAPAAPAGPAVPVQALKPTLECPAEIKVKFLDKQIPNTPFKFEGELSTEVKAKVSSTKTANADASKGVGVKGGPGLEIDLSEKEVNVVTKERVERQMEVLEFKFLGIAETKRSKDSVELLFGLEKQGTVLGQPITVKVTTGGTMGKKNELELIGIEGSIDLPQKYNVLQIEGLGFSGIVDWTMVKVKGALKADIKTALRWLAEKGGLGASAFIGPLCTAMGAIGGPLVFAFLSLNAFADMENFDNRVSNLATQTAVACKRLPEFLHMAKSTNAVETAFVDFLQKTINETAQVFDKDPHYILEQLRNNRDWQTMLRNDALASAKAAALAQGRKMADEYHESKWISILSKQHYRERADKIIETRFSLVEGAGWNG